MFGVGVCIKFLKQLIFMFRLFLKRYIDFRRFYFQVLYEEFYVLIVVKVIELNLKNLKILLLRFLYQYFMIIFIDVFYYESNFQVYIFY